MAEESQRRSNGGVSGVTPNEAVSVPSPLVLADEAVLRGNVITCAMATGPDRVEEIPGVKVVTFCSSWAVFPLSREELGWIWTSELAMRPWTETGRSESVKTVRTALGPKLGYPIEFFDAFVRVLQSGRYDAGSLVLLGNWELYCKYDPSRIIFELLCAQYGERRPISPRQVCKLPISSSLFSCVMVGMGCNGMLGTETSRGPLVTIGEVTKPEGHEYETGKMMLGPTWPVGLSRQVFEHMHRGNN